MNHRSPLIAYNVHVAEFLKTFLKKAQNIPSGENFHRRLAVLFGLIVKLRPGANYILLITVSL